MKSLFTLSLIGLLLISSQGFTQVPRTITGQVTDENGLGLPGVSVVQQETNRGTATGPEGHYQLEVPSGSILVFSMIGYLTREIPVNGQTRIDVRLESEVSSLDEVVVVGYGTQRKVDLTGAVSSIGAEDIARSGAITVDQALQGRIAGVQMTQNTGLPGGGTSIQIRGINSINSHSEPLIIIDGVYINAGTNSYTDNALAGINPADIESIDVLKDASALAIYGAQAANGVIIITTKKGKEGAPRVTFDAQYNQQLIPRYLEMSNLREYAQHQNELYTLFGWGVNSYFADPSKLSGGTNWQKEIFRPAAMQNYNLAVSGGSKTSTYKISGSYLDQGGIATGSGFKRLTLSTNLDTRIKSWVKMGGSLNVSNTDQVITITDWNLINSALRQSPSVPARNLDGTYGGPEDPNDALSNPLALAELLDRGNEKTRGWGNVFLEINPVKSLQFRSEVSANMTQEKARTFIPAYELGARRNGDIDNTRSQRQARFWAFRNIATFKTTFTGNHTVNFMLGQEMTENTGDYIMARRLGGSNQLPDVNAGDELYAYNAQYTTRSSFLSFFGRAFYSFNEKYLLTANLRYDGSSNFAEGHQWGLFPSASAAWRISEEPFLKGVDAVYNMKLRLGYGKVGNSSIAAFSHAAVLSNVPTIWGTGHLAGNVPNPEVTWESTSSYNIGLDLGLFDNRFELVTEVYSKRTDDLLLSTVLPGYTGAGNWPGASASPWANIGSLENRGVEFTLNTVNIDKPDFKWRSNLVYTQNKNEVLKLNTENARIDRTYGLSGTDYIVTRTEEGRSVGEFYGYKAIGRINSAEDVYDQAGNVKIALPENQVIDEDLGIWVGDLIWEDYNGDGVINEEDRQYLGSPLPEFTFGFGNTFSYKNFDLHIFFNGSYGNKIMNFLGLSIDNPNAGGGNITRRAAVDYARLDLIDPDGSPDDIYNVYVSSGHPGMPRMSKNNVNANNRLSSRFIEDGSYLRLQNVSLSYSAPQSLVSRFGLTTLKLNASARNLYTFTGYSGYDPEVGMIRHQYSNYGQDALLNGIDVGRYPSPRIYTLSLTVGL